MSVFSYIRKINQYYIWPDLLINDIACNNTTRDIKGELRDDYRNITEKSLQAGKFQLHQISSNS